MNDLGAYREKHSRTFDISSQSCPLTVLIPYDFEEGTLQSRRLGLAAPLSPALSTETGI